MDLPEDLKHLFLKWMQAEYSVKSSMKSRMAHTYYNAMKSLKQFPSAITHPKQLIDLKYFGDKLVSEMTSKLSTYCEEYGYKMPDIVEDTVEADLPGENDNTTKKKTAKKRGLTNTNDEEKDDTSKRKKTKKSTKKRYIPEINSGGYAILMALFVHDKHGRGMTKTEVIKNATPYCSSTFQANPATGNFYSAWSSVNTLIRNEYVIVEGTPKYYSLTDVGKEVSSILKEMNDREMGRQVNRSFTTSNSENPDTYIVANRSFTYPLQNNENRRINPLASSSPNTSRNLNSNRIVSSSPFRGGILEDVNALRDKVRGATTLQSSPLRTQASNNSKSEYQIWKSGSYEIKFLLDNREVFSKQERDFFSKTLQNMGINLEVRALPVGDGLWIAVNRHTKQETTLNFIFERKRLDDLAGSIYDGRFREQKSRLERTGMKTIFYIVEEQMGSDISKFADAIKTCISMNTTYSGFHTMKTKDADETMNLIKDITNLINKRYSNKTLLVLEPRSLNTQQEYKKLIDNIRHQFNDKEVVYSFNTFNEIMGKTAMTSVKEMFIRFLMTVRGVSLDKASAIQSHYKTPRLLCEAYKKCHTSNSSGSNCKDLIQRGLREEVGARRVGGALSAKLALVWCKQCCFSFSEKK